MSFTVSAPGKLILFGEHSVVYGFSAIAASIDRRTKLEVSENQEGNFLTLNFSNLNFKHSFDLGKVTEFISKNIPMLDSDTFYDVNNPKTINHGEFLKIVEYNVSDLLAAKSVTKEVKNSLTVFFYLLHGIFNKEQFLIPFTIDVTTELSLGAGTGSSASFCVCIAAALLHYKKIKEQNLSAEKATINKKDLKLITDWAFNGECILHGKPSGIDNTVATFGSFIEVKTFGKEKSFVPLDNPPKIKVILINTGVPRNTAKLVQKVQTLRSRYPTTIDNILLAMDEVSRKALDFITDLGKVQKNKSKAKDFDILEELIDMNQGLLYSLGVSHKSLQEICMICSDCGLHAKLTGAGGGGYAYALVPPNFQETKLKDCFSRLQKSGYEIQNVELGGVGIRLE